MSAPSRRGVAPPVTLLTNSTSTLRPQADEDQSPLSPTRRAHHRTDNASRAVTTARLKIEAVLGRHPPSEEARGELEAAVALLRSAEVDLTESRQSWLCSSRRSGVFYRKDPLEQLWEDNAVEATDSRRWLLETFTGADLQAVEGHQVGSSPSSPTAADGHVKRRNRLRTIQEIDNSLVSALGALEAEPLFESFGSLSFDAIAFGALPSVAGRPLQILSVHAIQRKRLVSMLGEQGSVPKEQEFRACLYKFLHDIEEMYKSIPYHNNLHAADVLMTMEWFLDTAYMREQVSPLDHLMSIVASAIHDVGHPGRNNLFYSKTMGPLAVTYNDKSVLENMHLALSFEAMQKDPQCNWFAMLPRAYRREDDEPSAPTVNLQQYVRRGLIDLVLATDMAKHAEHVQKLRDFVEAAAEEPELASPMAAANKKEALDRKLLLLESALHAADISNPCKPRPIMLQWTERVLAEFWAQGDEERRLGVEVSPLCDRESGRQAVPQGQIGFITFVIEPFLLPLAELIPEAKEAVDLLLENKSFWQEMKARQVPPQEIFALTDGR